MVMAKTPVPAIPIGTAGPSIAAASLALGGMLALASAMGIGRFAYTPILPAMVEALALTKTEAGLIGAANFLGYLGGALLAALPRLPGGRRAWFFASLVMGAAATAGMALAGDMLSFLLLRFLGGVASAFVLVIGSALILDRLGAAGRSGFAALHFAGVGLGIALSAVLVDVLQEAGAGWQVLWFGCGAAAGLMIPIVAWLVPSSESPPSSAPTLTRQPGSAFGFGMLSLCHGLFGFGYVVTATFLVAAVRAAPAARSLEAVVWIVVGLAAIPSTAIWVRAGARWGALRAYGMACLIEAVGVAAGGLWPTSLGALLASILLGGTFMGITALGFAAARTLVPDSERRSFALMTAAFGFGQIVGPLVAGWLLDRSRSFELPSLIAAAALLLAALIAMQTARSLARTNGSGGSVRAAR